MRLRHTICPVTELQSAQLQHLHILSPEIMDPLQLLVQTPFCTQAFVHCGSVL